MHIAFLATMLRILTICAALATSSAFAQTLWHGTTYGMTPDQVLAAVPGVVQVDPRHRGVIIDGSTEQLRLDPTQINGDTYFASFFFSNGRLTHTILTLRPSHLDWGADAVTSNAVSSYEQLITTLRYKYGQELNATVKHQGKAVARETDWVHGRTDILLYLIYTEGGADGTLPDLTIHYRVHTAEEADKL